MRVNALGAMVYVCVYVGEIEQSMCVLPFKHTGKYSTTVS